MGRQPTQGHRADGGVLGRTVRLHDCTTARTTGVAAPEMPGIVTRS